MPKMDGLSALRLITASNPKAIVIILSSLGGEGGKVSEALKLGASGVLTKPFSKEAIFNTFERIGLSDW